MSSRRSLVAVLGVVLVLAGVGLLWQWRNWRMLPARVVVTKQAPDSFATIAAVGDLACNAATIQTDTQCQFGKTAEKIRSEFPLKVLLLGDLQYEDGKDSDFTQTFGTVWGNLKQHSISATGNHEYRTPKADGYFNYWNGTAQSSEQAGDRDKGYFATNIGSWKIIVLNSNCSFVACDAQSDQVKWLQTTLQQDPAQCTLAMWHHPRFTSGGHADETATQKPVETFWSLLDSAGADVILNGHDHIYERFARQHLDQKVDNQNGMREFVVGTGGRNLYHRKQTLPNEEKFIDDSFGYLLLELHDGSYTWKFKNLTGKVLDTGTNVCSPARKN